ncbi:MAG TPA: thiolase family protein [Candidatus Binatia bacterium]|nr:thiolase family protein [Candidatus Binatia bacterium]
MNDTRELSGKAAIAGIGLSRFGKVPGTSAMGFALEASANAIADAGIPKAEIDGVLVLMPPQMGEQHGWASRVAVHLGIAPAFCSTMDMGGATVCGMIQTSAALIHAGICRAVLCAFGAQTNPQGILPTMFGSQFAIPYGDVGAMPFMAHVARRQMHEHGITSEQYGAISVAFRKHAARNPLAQKREPITIADHQSSRFIVEPLHLLDCCLVTDGGGAVVVTSTERARDLRHGAARIAGFGQVHSSEIIHPDRQEDEIGGGREAGERAYRMAGVEPEDVDVVQLYDGFTPLVMHELMIYGFCEPADVGAFVAAGNLEFDRGELPSNTAGGLLSEGHISGFGHVAEAVRQLRGTSSSQVKDVEVSMVTGYGGAPHEAPPTVAYTVVILTR